ncbi:hypothetical protein BDN70DRAFT_516649 [Pholiota conissans]|uniref:Uncharacterized protein n=1 Tax=Pholiota conissans TaxID=109636 RepID=A0A9P5YLG2_9AGAR|nr:hypothetical protein BDN70DRAFT_516649 [Pholiota conissans]
MDCIKSSRCHPPLVSPLSMSFLWLLKRLDSRRLIVAFATLLFKSLALPPFCTRWVVYISSRWSSRMKLTNTPHGSGNCTLVDDISDSIHSNRRQGPIHSMAFHIECNLHVDKKRDASSSFSPASRSLLEIAPSRPSVSVCGYLGPTARRRLA